MPAFNDKVENIDPKRIQKGNCELNELFQDLMIGPDQSIWFNPFIREPEIRMQVPVISYSKKHNDKVYYIAFSDWHEYDGFNGYGNCEGKFVIYECEDYNNPDEDGEKIFISESIEELKKKLTELFK